MVDTTSRKRKDARPGRTREIAVPEPSRPAPKKSRAPQAKGAATAAALLTEEERIESAKFILPERPPRVFEEERFLFPESYGVSRVRLLVKDPTWLFAYWDIQPETMSDLKAELGERAVALCRLTLRVSDPANGGSSVILVPEGARGWYVKTDGSRRSYRVDLGLTLPSGEFRLLAQSNTVVTPRIGASPERVTSTMTFQQAGLVSTEAALAAAATERSSTPSGAAPWSAAPQAAGRTQSADEVAGPQVPGPLPQGGASDVLGPAAGLGAAAAQGGASDTFRR